jgi:hypothetical protein
MAGQLKVAEIDGSEDQFRGHDGVVSFGQVLMAEVMLSEQFLPYMT